MGAGLSQNHSKNPSAAIWLHATARADGQRSNRSSVQVVERTRRPWHIEVGLSWSHWHLIAWRLSSILPLADIAWRWSVQVGQSNKPARPSRSIAVELLIKYRRPNKLVC